MAQFGFPNNGIRVRDPSQMFTFRDTNWVQGFSNNRLADSHESAGLLTKNRSQQAGIFSKPLIGNQFSGPVDKNLPKKEDDNKLSVAEASSSDENQPCFGLTQTTKSQTPPVNCFDPFRIGQQLVKKEDGYFKKLSQIPKSVKNEILNQNHMTSPLVSVKKEDCQQWSIRPANIWLCSPVKQNKQSLSVTGSCDPPSTPDAVNRRIRKLSTTPSLISKKRKFSTFQQNKEDTEGSSRLHDISTAELEWAHSVVRLPEKLNELAEEIEDSGWIIERKRRLILTTQLMQLLFQPPPANVLSQNAITHCDVVTYYASKLAMDSACSLCSSAGKNMTSKSSNDQDLLKVIEGFVVRSKRLETDILRLEKGESLIQVTMDLQDLEKFSFINRFAKFHTRRPSMVKGETTSSTLPKLCPQRCIKAIPMPKMVPEEQDCLFL